MRSILLLLFLSFITFSNYAQQSNNKNITQERLELLEYKVEAKLQELNLKEDNLELSKQNVNDIITFHKEGVEDFHRTLNYILVFMGIVVTVATAIGGYLLDRYNKRMSDELKKDIEALKISMQQNLDILAEEANVELEMIRSEARKYLENQKENKGN